MVLCADHPSFVSGPCPKTPAPSKRSVLFLLHSMFGSTGMTNDHDTAHIMRVPLVVINCSWPPTPFDKHPAPTQGSSHGHKAIYHGVSPCFLFQKRFHRRTIVWSPYQRLSSNLDSRVVHIDPTTNLQISSLPTVAAIFRPSSAVVLLGSVLSGPTCFRHHDRGVIRCLSGFVRTRFIRRRDRIARWGQDQRDVLLVVFKP